jgi:hypothetical protein
MRTAQFDCGDFFYNRLSTRTFAHELPVRAEKVCVLFGNADAGARPLTLR